jgi:hypothetical protein
MSDKVVGLNFGERYISVYHIPNGGEGCQFGFHDPFVKCVRERMIRMIWTTFRCRVAKGKIYTWHL